MDHMHVLGNEPSSVILSQTGSFKRPKKAEAKRDSVINPQNYNFNNFKYGKVWCSPNASNQPKSTVEFGYMSEMSKTFSACQTFGLTNLENLPDRMKTCQTEYKFYIVALLF